MKKCLKEACSQGLPRDVIAIGDSTAEIHALKDLMWAADSDLDLVKTVKFVPSPAMHALTCQLQLLQSWISPLIAHEEDVNVDMQDSARSSQIMEGIISASISKLSSR